MAKWADYAITAVRYDTNHTYISKCQIREDKGDKLDTPIDYSRQSIVNAIKAGSTFVTAFIKDSNWTKGADVAIYNIDGTDYLRTDKNRTPKDNLENLSEF